MTVITQLVQSGFKVRFMIGQFKCSQHPTIVGTVAAVVEKGNIPVGTQGMQEFQQRPRRLGKLEAVQTLL